MKRLGIVLVGIALLSGCAGRESVREVSQSTSSESETMISSSSETEVSYEEVDLEPEAEIVKVTAPNGEEFQYSLLPKWREFPNFEEINPAAAFFITNSLVGMAGVLEAKADYVDFNSYQQAMLTYYPTMAEHLEQSTEPVVINGMTGIELRMEASMNGVNAKYIVYVLEAPTNYVQLMTWTTVSLFDRNQEEMREIAETFKVADVGV